MDVNVDIEFEFVMPGKTVVTANLPEIKARSAAGPRAVARQAIACNR